MTHPTPRHSAGRLFWRLLTGAHLDGIPRTDAGWITPGTVAWTRSGRASRWAYRPRLYRAGVRLAVLAALAASAIGYALAPLTTELVALGAGTAGTVYTAVRVRRAIRTGQHRRQYVRPLHTVLAGQLGVPRATRPHEWLDVPVDYASNDDAQIRVNLPAGQHYPAELRRLVVDVIGDKLGISELSATWHTVGAEPYVLVKPAAHPPARVTFADVRELLATAPESAPIIGLAAGGRPVSVDMEAEAPHGLFSMASGAGKSVLVRTLAAQLLHNGAQVVVLDAKRVSQAWLRNLAGVTYCRTAETAHQVLLDLAAEVDRRYDLIDAADDDAIDTVDVGPRIVLIFEEMNAMIGKLNRYWQRTREKSDPKTSPALEAFLEIICMGRQGKVNCFAIAQLGTARTLGGPEVRESFSNRILGRYTRNAWFMLCPEVTPMPRPSTHQGRVQVVTGGQATETQVAFLTTAEAREWAASGAVTVPGWQSATRAEAPVTVTADPGPVTDPPAAPARPAEPLYTLAEAARQDWCPLGYDALRQAKSRGRKAGEWPAGIVTGGAERWTRAQLTAALSNRPRGIDVDDQAAALDAADVA